MNLYIRGRTYWAKFKFQGKLYRFSTGTNNEKRAWNVARGHKSALTGGLHDWKDIEQVEVNASWKYGNLYIITDGTAYKIGVCIKSVRDRIKTLSTGNPRTLRLCSSWRVINPLGLEYKLHSYFMSKHISGEWFNLDTDDLQYIEQEAIRCGIKL